MEWNVAIRCRPGLGHVFAFGFDPGCGVWIIVDPMRRSTAITLLPPWEFDAWLVGAIATFDVYRIEARDQTPVWAPGLWCVGAVKRLVGLKSGALSPAGLRRDLLRAGAKRVFSREGQNGSSEGRSRGDGGA